MKVLLLFPQADGQTGNAIQRAFENLGHEVCAVDAKREPGNSYLIASTFAPDLVFCSRTPALTIEVQKIKQRFKNAVTCAWNVDTRDTLGEWGHLFPLIRTVDYYFVVESNFLPQWRRELNAKTFWLPQGLQDEIYDKPRSISEEDRRRYECDICFCGSMAPPPVRYHGHRYPIIEAIREAGFKLNIWGSEKKPHIYNEEHNKQVALAKINLAMSGWPNVGKYVSVRDYKIMGAGGFLLERCGDGLGELFPLTKSKRIFDCYNSIADLIEKIRYWLANEDERKVISERAYRWIHENAIYADRIRMALEYMGL
ncbi:MAG: glycosyltransferase [Desulfobacteraceae bacterium]|nr:glycosyltransferase [Desulfobacteraceae bacterium]